jgi:uncharacterized glyoxalase superfamily protein PhnB
MPGSKKTSSTVSLKGMAPYLQVFDMPASIRFYRDQLGFEVSSQSQPELGDDCGWVLLQRDGIQLMLNTIYEPKDRPPFPDPNRSLGHADVAVYFGCPDVDALYDELTAKGLAMQKPYITGYGFKAVSLTDPDGYGLCFHWPLAKQ